MQPSNADQIALFEIVDPEPTEGTLAERFEAFHRANGHVLRALITLARGCKARGWKRASVNQLFERLRWDYAWQTSGEKYKLNNRFRAHYARLVMAVAPDLSGFFETRSQDNEYQPDLERLGLAREQPTKEKA